jgi:uncharacterized Fe-S cluster-containing MiaB family protein
VLEKIMSEVVNFPGRKILSRQMVRIFTSGHLDELDIPDVVRVRVMRGMEKFYTALPIEINLDFNLALPSYLSNEQTAEMVEIFKSASIVKDEQLIDRILTGLLIERIESEISFCQELGLIK